MLEPIERSLLWASVDGPNAHGESHPALHDFGELAEVLVEVLDLGEGARVAAVRVRPSTQAG